MKNKGFTLVELLAVMAILALLIIIVAPNVINMLDRSKKEKFIADAKELITLAKYKSKLEKYESLFTTSDNCHTINATNLDFSIIDDPDGNPYDFSTSQVMYCLENNKNIFYVKMYSTGEDAREVSGDEANNFVKESDLSLNNVK